jgi:hypothetical protein
VHQSLRRMLLSLGMNRTNLYHGKAIHRRRLATPDCHKKSVRDRSPELSCSLPALSLTTHALPRQSDLARWRGPTRAVRSLIGGNDDQIYRRCRRYFSSRSIGTSHAPGAASSVGRHLHANCLRMRNWKDASWRRLRVQKKHTRSSQVRGLGSWSRLPPLALVLTLSIVLIATLTI